MSNPYVNPTWTVPVQCSKGMEYGHEYEAMTKDSLEAGVLVLFCISCGRVEMTDIFKLQAEREENSEGQ